MLIKPFQFIGSCCECGEPAEDGAVAVALDSDADDISGYPWLCLKCALRAAKRIQVAVRKCREHMSAGEVYRNDKWQKPR